MYINGYKVSSTNPMKSGSDSFVRVYKDGVKIAEVGLSKRNPLRYVRQHPTSLYSDSLRGQLRKYGVEELDIRAIVDGN